MKRNINFIIFLIVLIGGAHFSAKAEGEINILFIGNSFTFRHDLNLLVEELVHEGKPNSALMKKLDKNLSWQKKKKNPS